MTTLVVTLIALATLLVAAIGTFTEQSADSTSAARNDHVTHLLDSLGLSSQQLSNVVSHTDAKTGVHDRVRRRQRAAVDGRFRRPSRGCDLLHHRMTMGRRLQAVPGGPSALGVIGEFLHAVRRYWLVETIFGLVVALFDTLALLVLHVSAAWEWGLVSFLTYYIPNVGFVLGLAPPALIGLNEHGVGTFVAVVVVYSALDFVIQSVVQPRVTGDFVGLTAATTFFSLVLWTYVPGPLGALLAVPATLLVKLAVIARDPHLATLGALMTPVSTRTK